MIVVCIFGPFFTGHAFTTIYPDYVRMPPSLSAYPQGRDDRERARATRSRGRGSTIEQWQLEDGERIFVAVTSAKPIDERVTRYLDRSNTFEDAQVEEQVGGRPAGCVMSAAIKQQYFLFGTDNTGRDLLTRTLIAGRISLAIGIFGRHRRGGDRRALWRAHPVFSAARSTRS